MYRLKRWDAGQHLVPKNMLLYSSIVCPPSSTAAACQDFRKLLRGFFNLYCCLKNPVAEVSNHLMHLCHHASSWVTGRCSIVHILSMAARPSCKCHRLRVQIAGPNTLKNSWGMMFVMSCPFQFLLQTFQSFK